MGLTEDLDIIISEKCWGQWVQAIKQLRCFLHGLCAYATTSEYVKEASMTRT